MKENRLKAARDCAFLAGCFLLIWQGTFFSYAWVDGYKASFVTPGSFIVRILAILAMTAGIVLYLADKRNKRRLTYFLISAGAVAVSLMVYRSSGDMYFALTVVLVVSAIGVDYRKILKLYFASLAAAFCLMLVLLRAGYLNNIKVDFSYGTGAAMGALHPNSFGRYLLVLVLLYWLLWGKKHPWITTGVSWACAAASCIVAVSRTPAVLLAAFPVLVWIFRAAGKNGSTSKKGNASKSDKRGKAFGFVMYVVIAVSFIGAAAATVLLHRQTSIGPDDFFWNFTERFSLAEDFYDEYGASWFGLPPDEKAIDMGYARSLLYDGYAGALMMFAGTLGINARLIKNKRWDIMLVMLVMLAYAFMEHVFDVPAYAFISTALLADLSREV